MAETNLPLISLAIQPIQNLKNILSNINFLLTLDAQHRKVFPEVPIVVFKREKGLKDLLVRAKEKQADGKYCGCSCFAL